MCIVSFYVSVEDCFYKIIISIIVIAGPKWLNVCEVEITLQHSMNLILLYQS